MEICYLFISYFISVKCQVANNNFPDKTLKKFPSSIQAFSAARFLLSNCNSETFDYILIETFGWNNFILKFWILKIIPVWLLTVEVSIPHASQSIGWELRLLTINFSILTTEKRTNILNKFLAKKIQLDKSDVIFQQIAW